MRRASVLPMIHVNCVFGQACCSVRTIGTTWQVSPIADSRSMQTLRGGSAETADHGVSRMSGRWPLGSEVKRKRARRAAPCYMTPPAPAICAADWFEPSYWQARGELEGAARGRGAALLHPLAASELRAAPLPPRRAHRRVSARPLLVARRGRARARSPSGSSPTTCIAPGLPVPAPIAARYRRHGAHLHRRPHHRAAARRWARWPSACAAGRCRSCTWIAIGRCIRRFHDLGVCHADLNAHNILLERGAGVSHRLRPLPAAQAPGCGATPIWCACAARWRR